MKKKYIALPLALLILLLCGGMLSGCGMRFNDYTGTYEVENLSEVSLDYRTQYPAGGNTVQYIYYNYFKLGDLYKEIKFFVGKKGLMFKAVPVSQTFTLTAATADYYGNYTDLIINTPLINYTYQIMQISRNGQGISLSAKNDIIQLGFDNIIIDSFYFNIQDNSVRINTYSYDLLKETFDLERGVLNKNSGDDNYGLNFKKIKSYDKLDEMNFFDNNGGNNGGSTENALPLGSYACYKVYNTVLETDLSELLDSFGYRFAIKANNKFDLYVSMSGIELPYALTGAYSVSGGKITFRYDEGDDEMIFRSADISGEEFICADYAEIESGNRYYFRKQ